MKFLLSFLAAAKFEFIPYGATAPTDRPTISCDGKIDGTTLELTHWTNHQTPRHLYADTSTEIALNYVVDSSKHDDALLQQEATILNNHYDTDGVLSVWTLLHPEQSLEYKDLLISGAEAGDFGEWTSDEGVKLDCILSALHDGDDAAAYQRALDVTLAVLKDLKETGGSDFQDLWQEEWQRALDGWNALQEGDVTISSKGPIAIVNEGASDLSCYALHRGLQEKVEADKITRVLHVWPQRDNKYYQYRYELPGHGWVQELVKREAISKVSDASKLVGQLGSSWRVDAGGLTSICSTASAVDTQPDDVVERFLELDEGALGRLS